MVFVKSLAFILLLCVCASQQESIKIELYYESLCPYCGIFIKEQLAPGASKLGDALEVELIPYGNAHHSLVNGKYEFNCQHGVAECRGNKIQACVSGNDNYTNKQKLAFATCMEESNDTTSDSQAQKCATDGIDWASLETCINSEEGDKLSAHFGDITNALNPPHQWVPWILLNGVYNQQQNDQLMTDMLGTLCKLYKEKPDACNFKRVSKKST